jgi:TP901 family phage tail tape measure protein
MPASVRDILLVIKTKENAQKSLNGISNAMRKTAAQADAASARARAASLRAQATQAKLNGATKAQVVSLQQSARAYDAQARSAETAVKKSNILRDSITSVGSTFEQTGLIMAGAGAGIVYGLKQAVDVATAWDKQVRMTYTQVDKRFKPSLQELGDIGIRVSTKIATPFEKVQEALFDVFSSTEANLPQAEKLLESFAKAAVAGNTEIQTASRATIGIMNAFKIPFKDVNKILDIQFQLVQEGVGTYEEWAQRIGLVTPSAVRAGQSVEQMAAALSTSTRMGISAARSGTAVARAFDAMSNPKVEKKLKEIGVASRDAKGNFRPLVDVMTDWRKELEKMPEKDRVGAILDVLKGAGSTIEARRFLQGILLTKGGLELFQNQVKEFATDKGAFQNAYNEMANSVSAKSQLLHNKWMQLKLTLGTALMPTFLKLIEIVTKLVDWFNKLSPSTQRLLTQIALWSGVLLVLGGTLTLVLGAVTMFAAGLATLGTAALPFLAAMALIAVAIAAFGAALVGLGVILVKAWNSSKNFRDMINSLKLNFLSLKSTVTKFATDLWTNFSTTILPSLRKLKTVVEQEVIPAVTDFVNWWTANMNPMLARAGEIINNQLKPAFQTVAVVIERDLIPALRDAKGWWDKNKAAILPVIKFMGMMLLNGIILAAWITGGLIKALAMGLSNLILFARLGKTAVVGAWKLMTLQGHLVVAIIKKIWEWFSRLGDGAKAGANKTINAMSNLKARIMGFFASAGTWLRTAGANIVRGLIGGISGSIDGVRQAARGVASAAVSAAKAALKISSPSKVFKDIGKDVVRGFILGVKDASTLKQLQTAMYRISRDVIRSINAADISRSARDKMRNKWNKRLSKTTKQLTSLEKKRLDVQKKLTAAQKSVDTQIKDRNELASKIKDAVAASASISNLTEAQQTSPESIKKGLQDRLTAVQQFYTDLRKLAASGLDKQTIADLASQGVDSAGKLVSTLATATPGQLKEISTIQTQIRNMATTTGTHVAGDLYNAGIKAGQGLVKGLQSQLKGITAAMTKIANALVKAIKKELGIKSPSRVFDKLGVNTAQGYINGYMKRMGTNMNDLQRATMFNPASPRVGMAPRNSGFGSAVGTTYTRIYDQKITVNTQEIDPRKTSAELGWELEGRLA